MASHITLLQSLHDTTCNYGNHLHDALMDIMTLETLFPEGSHGDQLLINMYIIKLLYLLLTIITMVTNKQVR